MIQKNMLKQKYNIHYVSLVQVKTNIVVTVYKDVGTLAEDFPYYLDAQTASALKLSNVSGYYHLSPAELVYLETNYGVVYGTINLDIQKAPVNNVPVNNKPVNANQNVAITSLSVKLSINKLKMIKYIHD